MPPARTPVQIRRARLHARACATLGDVHVHDVVVIGAGPAGLSAAAELASTHDCLLVDQGRDVAQRDRDDPADILAGIGGAGLFSDGKHSFWPSASALWTLPDQQLLTTAFDHTAALLARHGVIASAWHPTAQDPPAPGAWHLKKYPSIYMSLADRTAVIAELAAACPQRWTGARILAAARDQNHLRLTLARADTTDEVHTKTLVVATGRLSPRWIRPWLTALGVRFTFRRLEFGLRIESRSNSPLFQQLGGTDPKLRFRDPDSPSEARTFCVCRDGEVVLGRADLTDISAWSGRADGPPTGRSNLGLLVRTTDEPLARAVLPALLSAPPRALPLADLTDATLVTNFGPGAPHVRQALARLIHWCPALAHDHDAVAHLPCIEGVGDYPDDTDLALTDDIWTAGDVCGRFRGIVASMISGRYVAASIARALTTDDPRTRPRR